MAGGFYLSSYKIGVDLDGVCANFNKAYGRALIAASGKDLMPAGWYEDPSFPPVWDWDAACGYSPDVLERVWKQEIGENPKFWLELEPLPGVTDCIRNFNKLSKRGNDIYFLTNRLGANCKWQSERWLYEQGLDYPTVLIVSANKAPIIHGLGLQFFIDDRLTTMNGLMDYCYANRIYMGDKYFCLKDAPYNRDGRHSALVHVQPNLESALRAADLWV